MCTSVMYDRGQNVGLELGSVPLRPPSLDRIVQFHYTAHLMKRPICVLILQHNCIWKRDTLCMVPVKYFGGSCMIGIDNTLSTKENALPLFKWAKLLHVRSSVITFLALTFLNPNLRCKLQSHFEIKWQNILFLIIFRAIHEKEGHCSNEILISDTAQLDSLLYAIT